MEIDPQSLDDKSRYKLMSGTIVPRPIAWVSTVNAEGLPNLAPFSFFNMACSTPPTVLFCPNIRSTDDQPKDTLLNIRATGEFVVNIVTERLVEAMNITATELPAEINEFELAGLAMAPSVKVKPPRVADSPAHFECRLREVVTISDAPGGGYLVLGEVVHMHFDARIYREGHYIDPLALEAVGRLAGSDYTRVQDLFQVVRPPSQIRPKE